jgi:hypothetical protein
LAAGPTIFLKEALEAPPSPAWLRLEAGDLQKPVGESALS